jgi:hypothetical protein
LSQRSGGSGSGDGASHHPLGTLQGHMGCLPFLLLVGFAILCVCHIQHWGIVKCVNV